MGDKRRARQGAVGGNLTPQQARDILSIPVYALLAGMAVPIFPGTDVAGPSSLVGIFRKPGFGSRDLGSGRVGAFPCWVNDRQWARAVVPVLEDPRWNASNLLFQQLSSSDQNMVVRLIGDALARSFHAAGYGPLPPA